MRVLENGGTIEQHKAAVAAASAMKFDGVNCPTPGCDGITCYFFSSIRLEKHKNHVEYFSDIFTLHHIIFHTQQVQVISMEHSWLIEVYRDVHRRQRKSCKALKNQNLTTSQSPCIRKTTFQVSESLVRIRARLYGFWVRFLCFHCCFVMTTMSTEGAERNEIAFCTDC